MNSQLNEERAEKTHEYNENGMFFSADLSCNFESSLCGWSSVMKVDSLLGNLKWKPHSRVRSVGPLYDRSSVDGSKYVRQQEASQSLNSLA